MHRPLFAYGTLRDAELLATVLGHPVEPASLVPATAPHYRTVRYPGRSFPAIVPSRGATAEGILIHDLDDPDWELLDAFESAHYQRRTILILIDGEIEEAESYWPVLDIPADALPWSFTDWLSNQKAQALVSDGAVAAELRQRLSAITPEWPAPGGL